jgi:hypothetical protein
MAEKGDSKDALRENPLVARFIERGADTSTILRGFIGPAIRDGHVRLYPRLNNLSNSVEVAREDILHSIEAPQSALGAVILWVKKDAKISIHRAGTSEATNAPRENDIELRQGRLRMRVRPQQTNGLCFSHCMDCVSWCSCSLCSSLCRPQ